MNQPSTVRAKSLDVVERVCVWPANAAAAAAAAYAAAAAADDPVIKDGSMFSVRDPLLCMAAKKSFNVVKQGFVCVIRCMPATQKHLWEVGSGRIKILQIRHRASFTILSSVCCVTRCMPATYY